MKQMWEDMTTAERKTVLDGSAYAFTEFGQDHKRSRAPLKFQLPGLVIADRVQYPNGPKSHLDFATKSQAQQGLPPPKAVFHPASFPESVFANGRQGMRDQRALRLAWKKFPESFDFLQREGWVGTPNCDPWRYAKDRVDSRGEPWDEYDEWYRFEQDQLGAWDPVRVRRDAAHMERFLKQDHEIHRFLVENGWVGNKECGGRYLKGWAPERS